MSVVATDRCPISNPPACPDVTPEEKIVLPIRPPWLNSVGDLAGEVAAGQIDPRHLPDLAAYLLRERIGYYWPKERVRRRSAKGWKEYDRSLFSGTLFFEIGCSDDRAKLIAAQDYCRYFGWRLGLIRAASGASQSRLRQDLANLELLLGYDPTLSARNRIEPGDKVRVTVGPLMGMEGIAVGDGPQATVQVVMRTLGQSVPVEIAREMLEAA